MNRKRMLAIALTAVLGLCQLFGCNGKNQPQQSTQPPNTEESGSEQQERDEWGREMIYSPLGSSVRYDGEKIVFLARDGDACRGQFEETGTNSDRVNSALVSRNSLVEDRLGVELSFSYTPQGNANSEYNAKITQMVMNDQLDADIASAFAYYSSAMLYQGFYRNLTDIENLYLEQPYWNRSYIEEAGLNGQLYLLVGDLSLLAMQNSFCVFFNRRMLSAWFGDRDLYAAVRNKEWTYEYFLEMVKDVYVDSNPNGRVDEGDTFGLAVSLHSFNIDAFFAASGCKICTKEDGIPKLTLNTDRTWDAYDKTLELLYETKGSYVTDANADGLALSRGAFREKRSLFAVELLKTGADFSKEMDVNSVGVLPLYLGASGQTEYTTTAQDSYDTVSIIGNVSLERAEVLGAVMEMMSYYSYMTVRPEYFEMVVKRQYSSSGDDANMYDLIIDSVYFDYGMINSNAISRPNLGHLWRNCLMSGTPNFSGAYKVNIKTYEDGLLAYLDYFSSQEETE